MADVLLYDGVVLKVTVPQSPAVVAVVPEQTVLHVVPAFGPKGDPGTGGGGGGAVASVNGRIGVVVGLAEASDIPDVSGFVTSTALDLELDGYATTADLADVQAAIPDVSVLATKLELDGVESQIPNVSGFATTAALAGVQAQIPDVSGLASDAELAAVAATIPSITGLATSAQVATDISTASTADRARGNHTGTQTASTISDFNTTADARINAQKGQPNGVATLTSGGKLTASQVPAIAVTDTFVVASQAAMLALSAAEQGDVAVRTDLNKSFILRSDPYSTLANWTELLTPTSPVSSVNGRVGAVTGLAEQSAVDSALAGKEPTLPTGTSSQYFRGDKTVQSLSHDVIADGVNYKRYSTAEQSKLGSIASAATANAPDAYLLSRANHTGSQSADTIDDGSTNKAYTATEKTKLTGIASGATANSTDAVLFARSNHTGTQSADTITDGLTIKAFTTSERSKLTGITSGATANSSDATLLNRANHTGTQAQSTITNLTTDLAAKASAATLAANGKGYCNAGTNVNTARPVGFASVEWRCTAGQPVNMTTDDSWLNAT